MSQISLQGTLFNNLEMHAPGLSTSESAMQTPDASSDFVRPEPIR